MVSSWREVSPMRSDMVTLRKLFAVTAPPALCPRWLSGEPTTLRPGPLSVELRGKAPGQGAAWHSRMENGELHTIWKRGETVVSVGTLQTASCCSVEQKTGKQNFCPGHQPLPQNSLPSLTIQSMETVKNDLNTFITLCFHNVQVRLQHWGTGQCRVGGLWRGQLECHIPCPGLLHKGS